MPGGRVVSEGVCRRNREPAGGESQSLPANPRRDAAESGYSLGGTFDLIPGSVRAPPFELRPYRGIEEEPTGQIIRNGLDVVAGRPRGHEPGERFGDRLAPDPAA